MRSPRQLHDAAMPKPRSFHHLPRHDTTIAAGADFTFAHYFTPQYFIHARAIRRRRSFAGDIASKQMSFIVTTAATCNDARPGASVVIMALAALAHGTPRAHASRHMPARVADDIAFMRATTSHRLVKIIDIGFSPGLVQDINFT